MLMSVHVCVNGRRLKNQKKEEKQDTAQPYTEESVRENVALPKALIQKKDSQAKSIR